MTKLFDDERRLNRARLPCLLFLRAITHVGGIKGPFGVRQDSWELISGPGEYGGALRPGQPGKPQLFDLATDLAETRNVVAPHPEIVQQFKELVAAQREHGRTR